MLSHLLKLIKKSQKLKKFNFTNESVIVLEADGSDNNDLVTKVYIPMGFTLLSSEEEEKEYPRSGGLMISDIDTVLQKLNINLI